MGYAGRIIEYSSRKRIHSLDELSVFDGKARDYESGIEEESRHFYTSQEAIEHALEKLKKRLLSEGLVG